MDQPIVWTKDDPSEPGSYWMRDEGGGPTLYVCEMVDGELRCGPSAASLRFPIDGMRMATTEWSPRMTAVTLEFLQRPENRDLVYLLDGVEVMVHSIEVHAVGGSADVYVQGLRSGHVRAVVRPSRLSLPDGITHVGNRARLERQPDGTQVVRGPLTRAAFTTDGLRLPDWWKWSPAE